MPFERRVAEAPEDPVEEAAGADVPECGTDTVTFEVVTEQEVLGGGGSGLQPEGARNVALMARPGESCGLSAWPTLRLASDAGDPGPLVPDAAVSTGWSGGRLLLTGRQRLVGIVRWDSSCLPAEAEVRVEAVLAEGDVVSAALPEPPACDESVTNTVSPWMTFPQPAPESPLAVTLDTPDRAPFDGTLRFNVVMDNEGDEAVALDPCPIYWASFGESGTAVFLENELNCDEAPDEIAPGDRLRFAVEMEIPGDEVPAGFAGGLFVRVHLGDGSLAYSDTVGLDVGGS